MATTSVMHSDPSPIVACTISRDVQNFDLLIEDMEDALGEAWGDLGFAESLAFFGQPEAETLEVVAIAVDQTDEEDIDMVMNVIRSAKGRGIKVILIAEGVSPGGLHTMLRSGADEFIPYPLPENEVRQTIERLRTEEVPVAAPAAAAAGVAGGPRNATALSTGEERQGVIIAVQGLAGGVGSTTFAVNLAWELATADKNRTPRVCLLDLDLQHGSVGTYLDLPRRDSVLELLSDTESMDDEAFGQALLPFEDKVQVLTSPGDLVPLDLIGPDDIEKILDVASRHYDYVVIDMPKTIVQWSETVLTAAHVYFAMIQLDMRSAQNTLRLKQALQGEGLPFEKMRFLLNHAPKFTDLNGKSRVKRMAESLGISLDVMLPDGGKPVPQSCDHGVPLASTAAKNPLRKEIMKLAASLIAIGHDEAEAA